MMESTMKITIEDRGTKLGERLRDRLESAAVLRCDKHGEPVEAVTIHGFENGWFDAMWTTCCEHLRKQAAAIVRARC
jgi:hypothetical protein